MALSTTEETIESGTVGKVTYDLTFEGYVDNPPGYVKKEHVFLWINDVQQTLGGGAEYDGSGVTFTWDTTTRVTIVGYSPVLDDKIEFRRTMPTDKPVVDFVDRAGITEKMLDNLALSNLYAVHEIKDGFGTGTQNYYALAKLYANGAEDYEVEPGQYSAYHWSVKASSQEALCAAQVDLAEEAAADAATAQGLAETAQGLAADARDAAISAQEDAELAEDGAVAAQGLAEAAQADAELAQTGAETAQGLAEAAKDDAELAESNAAASALAAAGSATDASDDADAAAASALTASGYADDASDAKDLAESAKTDAEAAADAAETESLQTLSISTGEVAWDWSSGVLAKITMTDDAELSLPTNMTNFYSAVLIIEQDGSGGHSLSFDAAYDGGAAGTPSIKSGAGEVTMLGFMKDAAGTGVRMWKFWEDA